MKKLIKLLAVSILIFASIPWFQISEAEATEVGPKLKILQIHDNKKDIKLLKNKDGNFDITTMDMKSFVAERKDLDGLYDAIYIAEGTYSPALPKINGYSVSDNNTKNIMNDITLLKANDIIKFYVEKGLPVYLHHSIKDLKVASDVKPKREIILKKKLYSLVGKYENVKSILNLEELKSNLNNYSSPRPLIHSVTSNTEKGLNSGDTLSIDFTLDENVKKDKIDVKLYLDYNLDNQFDADEIVKDSKLGDLLNSTNSYTINYKLQENYSGIHFWKLEIVDQSTTSNLKDYKLGSFNFTGVDVNIRVLQVLDPASSNNLVTMLNELDEFEITQTNNKGKPISGVFKRSNITIAIDVVSKDTFQSENSDKGYNNITNGKYNMLVFGFQDEYGIHNNIFGSNSDAVVEQINNYISQGKSIFFTHDTLLEKGTKTWTDNFLKVAAQKYKVGTDEFYKTNMGYGAKLKTTEAKLVNTGLMTMYPFDLTKIENDTINKEIITINTTHAQYFMLDLEDREVIPWYNLYNNSELKGNDAWNHYYTYSYKNITYSGAGHNSSGGFSMDEKQLFINTMYRAFLSSNAEPTIEVVSPKKEDTIYSYQKTVPIKFFIRDIDRYDLYFDTRVTVNGVEILKPTKVSKDILQDPAYILKSTDKKLEILIEVTDPKGSKVQEKWTVDVLDLEGKFIATKEFTKNLATEKLNQALGNGYVQQGSEILLDYTLLAPEKIKPNEGTFFTEDAIFNFNFKDTIPKGITILENESLSNLSNVKYNKVNHETKIEGILPSIEYEIKDGDLHLKEGAPKEINFSIKIKLDEIGKFKLNQSFLKDNNEEVEFNTLDLKVVEGLKDIIIEQEVNIRVGIPENIELKLIPNSIEEFKKELVEVKWEILEGKEIIDVINSNLDRIVIQGKTKGKSKIKVIVEDILGNKIDKVITIYVDTINIKIHPNPIFIKVGESKKLDISFEPDDITNKDVKVEVKDLKFASYNANTKEITGEKVGFTILTVKTELDKNVVVEVPIYVGELTITVNPNPIIIDIGQSETIKVEVIPDFIKNKNVIIDVEDKKIAEFAPITNKVIGRAEGKTNLVVTSVEDPKIQVKVSITVNNPSLKEIKFVKPYFDIKIGEKKALLEILIFNPSTVKKEEIERTLQVSSTLGNKVKVDRDGNGKWYIEGVDVGTSLVTVKAPIQIDGKEPKSTSAYFEVKNESTPNSPPTNGKW